MTNREVKAIQAAALVYATVMVFAVVFGFYRINKSVQTLKLPQAKQTQLNVATSSSYMR